VLGEYGSEIEAVVDIGFTGQLTLTPEMVEYLILAPAGNRDVALADDHTVDFAAYVADIVWHDRVVPIEVLSMGGTPLVGMELLGGSELRAQATPGGRVEIEELP
jgi:clan AA aspartic protease